MFHNKKSFPVKIISCSNSNNWYVAFIGEIIYVTVNATSDYAKEEKTKRPIPLTEISGDLTCINCIGQGYIHDMENDDYLECDDCQGKGYIDNILLIL